MSANVIAVDTRQDRAGLACDVCRATSWLPLASGAGSTRVVDVDPAPSARPEQRPALGTSAMVPAHAHGMTPFSPAEHARILAKAPLPAGEAQTELAQRFERLLGSAWSNESEHKQFVKRASMLGELAFAGQRYRAALDAVPDDEQAKRAQSEILGLAMATLAQHKDLGATESQSTQRSAAVVVAVMAVVIIAAAIVFGPRLLRGPSDEATMDVVP